MKEILTYILPISATIISIVVSLYSTIKYLNQTKKKKEELEMFLRSSNEFKELQKVLNDSKLIDEKEILKDFEDINNVIKNIFDDLTKSQCRTTIKVISYDENIPVVLSLVSQQELHSRQAIFMNKTNLLDDTSLSVLFNRPFDYYLENDLSKFYKNVHFPIHSDDKESNIFFSTLVVPIILSERNSENSTIFGFLSIDSSKKNAFSKDLHISIAKSFSNSLLPFIESWTKRIAKNNGLTNNQILTPE